MTIGPHRRDLLVGAAATATAAALPQYAAPAEPATGSTISSDLAYRNAADLVKALAAKQISSVELTDFAIARIITLDKRINAVVVRDFDRAREAAKMADNALARGDKRPLLG